LRVASQGGNCDGEIHEDACDTPKSHQGVFRDVFEYCVTISARHYISNPCSELKCIHMDTIHVHEVTDKSNASLYVKQIRYLVANSINWGYE
jgi:hypothetical protein